MGSASAQVRGYKERNVDQQLIYVLPSEQHARVKPREQQGRSPFPSSTLMFD